jgi:hypothetical protein
MSLIASMGDQLMFYQNRVADTEVTGDTFDQILALAWMVSEIAIDVFGMLFWSALGLFVVRIITWG